MSAVSLTTPAISAQPAATYDRRVASLRAAQRAYARTLAIVDVVIVAFAILVGYLGRFMDGTPEAAIVEYPVVCTGLFAAWIGSLWLARCYDPRLLGYGSDEYRRVLFASLRLAGAVAILFYLTDAKVARGFLAILFAVGTAGLVGGRYAARKRLHRARGRGRGWSRRVLVVGDVPHVLDLTMQLRRDVHTGYRVVGACIPDALRAPEPQRLGDVPVVGSFRTILNSAAAVGADTIAVTASGELTSARLRRLGWQLEQTDIDLVVAPALTDIAGPRIHTQPVAGLPLIHVEAPEFRGGRKLVKGLVDRTIALAALTAVAPVLLMIAAAIKLDSRGPVIFRQARIGREGREFSLYKFRTMVDGAHAMRDILADRNEQDGLLFKMRSDPRVTRVGRRLRAWSLDELPQLINVVRGQMSLVGPRPPLPEEVARYDGDIARRLLVKPGITGLWQVSGRSDLSWYDGIRLDLYYVENWSLTADLTILWKTIGAVVRRRGAY
jgi:exopolysaccharide biosynthesis polyprenyl glycosylphosphotransferase